MGIVFFVLGYLVFAWIMGRILNAMLECLLADGSETQALFKVVDTKDLPAVETIQEKTASKRVRTADAHIENGACTENNDCRKKARLFGFMSLDVMSNRLHSRVSESFGKSVDS